MLGSAEIGGFFSEREDNFVWTTELEDGRGIEAEASVAGEKRWFSGLVR